MWLVSDWLEGRRRARRAAAFRDGFDWAAGCLLRGEETPETIEAYTFGGASFGERPWFDRGADEACRRFSKLVPEPPFSVGDDFG